MSRQVICVEVPPLTPHPNADTLDLGMVWDTTPVLVKRGEFQRGELAAFWEVDTIHPEVGRIKAKRLRGVFSMGMLTPLPPQCVVSCPGDDITTLVGAAVYDSDASTPVGKCSLGPMNGESCPHEILPYTDVQDLRKNWHHIRHGEDLIITEKIHGTSARYMHDGERLWVGTRRTIIKDSPGCVWWAVAHKYDLARRLKDYPMHVFCGEIYGKGVQKGYHYDVDAPQLALYDVRLPSGLFAPFPSYIGDLPRVIRFQQDFKTATLEDLEELADAPSLYTSQHLREGIVVRVDPPRLDSHGLRCVYKLVSRKYLEKKGQA